MEHAVSARTPAMTFFEVDPPAMRQGFRLAWPRRPRWVRAMQLARMRSALAMLSPSQLDAIGVDPTALEAYARRCVDGPYD